MRYALSRLLFILGLDDKPFKACLQNLTPDMSEVTGASLLDALKRKMQQNRDEGEKFRDEAEGKTRILQVEVRSREEAEGLIANLNRKVVSLDKNAEAVEK